MHGVGCDDEMLGNSGELEDRGSLEIDDVENRGVLDSNPPEFISNTSAVNNVVPVTE
jgi:hypothetical protein